MVTFRTPPVGDAHLGALGTRALCDVQVYAVAP